MTVTVLKKSSKINIADFRKHWMQAAMLFLLLIYWLFVALYFLLADPLDYSVPERRKLSDAPSLTLSALKNGSYLSGMEAYAKDRFPGRELFRNLKTASAFYGFFRLQDNGYAITGSHLARMDMQLNTASVSYACRQMQYLYDTYLADSECGIYYCMIPDKNYYLHQEEADYPVYDYNRMETLLEEQLSFALPIDIKEDLQLSSFYLTDTHWKQEALLPAAQTILSAMSASAAGAPAIPADGGYSIQTALPAFHGVLSGNMGWNAIDDPLLYLTNDTIASARVSRPEGNNCHTVYDETYLTYNGPGADPYSFFLSGANAVITIERASADSGTEPSRSRMPKELVIFRDSFGSSIAPLFLDSYDKITLIDTRYINPDLLRDYITFTDQDVLFLYSTLLLNNSYSLKEPLKN